jgi:putative copper resistance protein D
MEENIVQLVQGTALSRTRNLRAVALLFIFLFFLFVPMVRSQQHDMGSMPGMNMHASHVPEDPAVAAKRLADKRESEFNHHLAGAFVIFAGILILAEGRFAKRWPLVHYAWPMCFIGAGLFVLVFSDTEIWPFGPQSPWYAITHNTEDLQHKIFAIILLALGYVEFQRSRGRLKSLWAAWFFPVVGVAGAILLLFHVHGGNMEAPSAMETMEHIQKQHRWFATAGVGIALANGLAGLTEKPEKWHHFFRTAWPTLLIVLGVLLTLYTE